MKQILHIFAKDTRRFWIEIALSLGLLAAFVWASWFTPGERGLLLRLMPPRRGSVVRMYIPVPLGYLVRAIALLVPSWWLLISRVVLDEPLVGDRQFWITRPYEWKKLLAAKSLFLFCWIVVGYLLAETLLLANAGFSPIQHVPGLLGNVLFVSVAVLLPVFALTSVTSNFTRMVLTLLVALVLISWYVNWVGVRGTSGFAVPPGHSLLLPIVFLGCAAVLVLQYATRKTWSARAALVAVALVAAALPFYERRQSLVDAAYADTGVTIPLAVVSSQSEEHPVEAREFNGIDYIDLQMQFLPEQNGSAYSVDEFRFTLTGADGKQWSSPWQEKTNNREGMMLQSQVVYMSLPLRPATFDRFKGGPSTLHVEFGVSRYAPGTTTKLTVPSDDAAVPGIGFCAAPRDREGRFSGGAILRCRAAVDETPMIYATAVASDVACGEAANTGQSGTPTLFGAWTERWDDDMSLSPVKAVPLRFEPVNVKQVASRLYLCPGTPMDLTPYHVVNRGVVSITIPGFQFPQLKKT